MFPHPIYGLRAGSLFDLQLLYRFTINLLVICLNGYANRLNALNARLLSVYNPLILTRRITVKRQCRKSCMYPIRFKHRPNIEE